MANKEQQIPEELKKKFKEIKVIVNKFKKEVLKKFDEYIVSIALLPPEQPEKDENGKEKPIDKNKINVLVLVDDADSEKMSKDELGSKLGNIIKDIAQKTDKNLSPEVMIISELKEACYDGRYEVLDMISKSAPVYDKGMLSALKVAEIHKKMTIEKFEKYVISYIGVGSLFRGDSTPKDIDIAIVIDDTDVKRMNRIELRDKLGAIIRSMGHEATQITGIKGSFHVQVYILTDFWDSIKDAHPVIFTFLRDGVPLYDRGVFMPWRLLLKMGRIKPSPEAIDMQMDVGEKLLERVKGKMLSVVGEDLYYATLNPAQAALMLYGIAPPTPKETVKLMEEIFVKKEKLLEQKYVDILEKIRKYYKDIEHEKIKEVNGAEIDKLFKESSDYLKRIKKLFAAIEKRKQDENILEIHDTCISIVKDALKVEKATATSINVANVFKKTFVDSGKLPEKFLKILKVVIKAKKDYDDKKLTKQESEKVQKEARILIKVLVEYIQRSRGYELERTKIRVKYGDKFAEVILLDKVAFIINDIDAQKKDVLKAKLLPSGQLGDTQKSSLEELEKTIVDSKKLPEKTFIKQPIFDDLKKLFGKDVEILINY